MADPIPAKVRAQLPMGYTHNPRATGGLAHVVIGRKAGESVTLACGTPSQAMEQLHAYTSPKRPVCVDCAAAMRTQLLLWTVELFGDPTKPTNAQDALAFLRALADRARDVVPEVVT